MDYKEAAEKNIILKVRVGSHLFGTNTKDSDLDMEGVFIPPVSVVFGLGKCKEVDLGKISKDDKGRNTKAAVDFKIREYREFIRLAIQNNPNILNILFINDQNILSIRDAGRKLLDIAEMFPHRKGLDRFIGYAMGQMKKMRIKPDNYDKLKKAQEFLDEQNPKEIVSSVIIPNQGLVDHGVGKSIQVGDIFMERGITVKRAIAKIKDRRFRASSRAQLWEENGYDVKFAANLVQILYQGIELSKTGRLEFPLDYAGYIMEIKRGEYSLEYINAEANRLIDTLSKHKRKSSVLSTHPRYKAIENFVIDEMKMWVGNICCGYE